MGGKGTVQTEDVAMIEAFLLNCTNREANFASRNEISLTTIVSAAIGAVRHAAAQRGRLKMDSFYPSKGSINSIPREKRVSKD